MRQSRPALNTSEYLADMVELAKSRDPSVFDLKIKLPAQGRADVVVAATSKLSVVMKAYASGGENALHAHINEDHAFIVMQGEVTFFGTGDQVLGRVGRNQGIMLPKGALYRFVAGEREPLVMMRIGSMLIDADLEKVFARVDEQGRDLDGYSHANKEVPVLYDENIWFGA